MNSCKRSTRLSFVDNYKMKKGVIETVQEEKWKLKLFKCIRDLYRKIKSKLKLWKSLKI